MKKSLKTLVFTTMAAGMLAGCAPAAAANWSKEDLELMKDKLYGYVLPYLNEKGLSVKYDDKSEILTIRGGSVSEGELEKYAAKFTEKDGWGEFPEGEAEEGEYLFRRAFDVPEAGKRYLVVDLYADEHIPDNPQQGAATGAGEDQTPELEFVIEIWDPYFYEIPAAQIGALFENFEHASDSPIAFGGAEYYVIDDYHILATDETFENFLIDYISVVGKGVESDPSASYSQALTTAGWSVANGVSVSPNEQYKQSFGYDAEKKEFSLLFEGGFDYGYNGTFAWPAKRIAKGLTDLFEATDVLPAFPVSESLNFTEALSFRYTQDEAYTVRLSFETAALASQAANEYNSYLLTEECGFEYGLPSGGSKGLESPNKQFSVSCYSSRKTVVINISAPVEGITEWPTDTIAADMKAVGLEGASAIPEFEEDFYHFEDFVSPSEGQIQLVAYLESPVDVAETYKVTLQEAGFKFDYSRSTALDDGSQLSIYYFTSPDSSYQLVAYCITEDGLTYLYISVTKYLDAFPQKDFEDTFELILSEEVPASAYIPDFSSITNAHYSDLYTEVDEDDGLYAQVTIRFADSAAADAGLTAINGLLTNMGCEDLSVYGSQYAGYWYSADWTVMYVAKKHPNLDYAIQFVMMADYPTPEAE